MDDPGLRYPNDSIREENWAAVTAFRCKDLEEAVKALLWQMLHLGAIVEIHDPELARRLKFHMQIKGQWFSEFMAMYEAGRIELP